MARELAHRRQLRREADRSKGIRRHAARLALGEIGVNRFLIETADDWRRLAQTMHNAYRNKLPESLAPEDLAQDMQMEAVRVLPKWKPSLRSVGDYLIFNACSKARKVINRERESKDRDGKEPSRFPIPVSRMSKRNAEGRPLDTIIDRLAVDADQEDVIAGRELYRQLSREIGRSAPKLFASLRDGDGAALKVARNHPAIARAIERLEAEGARASTRIERETTT